jgi:capsular exopolysaccharide synthesis family protein
MNDEHQLPRLYVGNQAATSFSGASSDARWVFQTLLRRKLVVFLPALLFAIMAAAVAVSVPNRYTATAMIRFDPRGEKSSRADATASNMFDKESLNSQRELLQAQRMAQRVITQLDLVSDPEFNRSLKASESPKADASMSSTILAGAGSLFGRVDRWMERLEAALAPNGAPQPADRVGAKVLGRFLRALGVTLKQDTRVLSISFTSIDPEKAAKIANAVAQNFMAWQITNRQDALRGTSQWLAKEVAGLQARVQSEEKRIADYRKQSKVLVGNDDRMIAEQISALNLAIIDAKTKRSEAEARLAQVGRAAAGGTAAAMQDVLQSKVIQDLTVAEVQAKGRVAMLEQELGRSHPRLTAARSELADIEEKIGREVNRIVSAVESEVRVAQSRESQIQATLGDYQRRLADANETDVTLRGMTRTLDADQALLNSLLARQRETEAQLDTMSEPANVEIIADAIVPLAPSFPPKAAMVAAALIAPLLVAAAVVLWTEHTDRRLRSGEHVENSLGTRSLGLIPLAKFARGSIARQVAANPATMFGEALRSVLLGLRLQHKQEGRRTLLVTSAQAKEGKTTVACALAAASAAMGARTVVIDADLRQPRLHKAAALERRPGLVDVVAGTVDLSQALVEDEESRVTFLPVGEAVSDPMTALTSENLRAVLGRLGRSFDLVIVDAPPIIPVADARVLSTLVDSVVVLARWGRSDASVLGYALKLLRDAGADVAGVELTMVDQRKHARYGFSDSALYYESSRRYYLTA